MKPRVINENPGWTFVVPDSVADWDGPSHWERERLASMQANLHPGEVLLDIRCLDVASGQTSNGVDKTPVFIIIKC
jgi:hypothetical protein